MNNLDKPDRAEERTERILSIVYSCIDDQGEWYRHERATKEVAAVLRAYRNEALEEAAKVADEYANVNRKTGRPDCSEQIRSLKTPEAGK